MSEVLRPGSTLGPYPERRDCIPRAWEQAVSVLAGRIQNLVRPENQRMCGMIRKVEHYGALVDKLSEEELNTQIYELRSCLIRQGFTDELVARSFAIIRCMSGHILGMRHYDVQLMGGWAMLKGMLAEMETGEGKTLTATLPACIAAMSGVPVHIITVNDYLATRDARLMEPLFRAFGLRVGVVTEASNAVQRRAAYSCDVTYCTNKQVAFDYLRDRISRGGQHGSMQLQLGKLQEGNMDKSPLLLRGLCFAIIDEADSVLIDEARTPLIISRSRTSQEQHKVYEQALTVANQLLQGKDFFVQRRHRGIELTEKGEARIIELTRTYKGVWSGPKRSCLLVTQALCAQHLYQRDTHYLVDDKAVQIIDEHTGRRMPDRSWEQGLHQMIEVKEGCELTSERETLARISYQRFFRRYLRLAGMTGTAKEVAGEVKAVYGLDVISIPTHRPLQRARTGYHVYVDSDAKWKAVVARVRSLNSQGRPILVGTRSVAISEYLSKLLAEDGLPHQMLNARQDMQEADIVAVAGQAGSITVATNMAGRGTDIGLGEGVAESGGLHVIATELNDARRIDRQLFGRSGRQGDPGSFEVMVALDDPLLQDFYPECIYRTFEKVTISAATIPGPLGMLLTRVAQIFVERGHQYSRRSLLRMDEQLDDLLAFSGCGE